MFRFHHEWNWLALLMAVLFFGLLGAGVAVAGESNKLALPVGVGPGGTYCPKTLVGKDCMVCHAVRGKKFVLRELPIERTYHYPNIHTSLIFDDSGKPVAGRLVIEEIRGEYVVEALDYCRRHNLKRIVIELYSPGGSVMEAWRIVGHMQEFKAEGRVIETKVYGFAASAGFLVTVAGSQGHRYASPNALLMWHEVISFKMFDISTPSDKEEESRTLRFFQDVANRYIAERCKLSKDELDRMIRKRNQWMNGKYAMMNGFVDHLIAGDAVPARTKTALEE